MATEIHPTALVDPRARIEDSARIGAYSVIGPDAVVGPDVEIAHHVTLLGRVILAAGVKIGPGSIVGGDPQDLYRTLQVGLAGTPMPSYRDALAADAPATLSPKQKTDLIDRRTWAMVQYVLSLSGGK